MRLIRIQVVAAAVTAFLIHTASAQLPAPAPGAHTPVAPKPADTTPAPKPASDETDLPYIAPSSNGEAAPSAPIPTPTPNRTPKPPARSPVKKPTPKVTSLTVGGVSIRGLSDVAAIRKLRRVHAPKLRETITLFDGKKSHRVRRSSLGASIPYYKLLAQARARQRSGGNVPLQFQVDVAQARRTLKSLASKVNHASANAGLDVDLDGKVLMRGGEGAELAIEGSTQRIKEALESDPPQNYVELVVARQPGSSTLRQFRHLLAEYSTPYDASIRGRTNNLKMAARNVDGTIVQPGKIFSTNSAIGPRNAAAGWKEAKMFVDGQVVDGVGAGICQCATTLYNAALLANFPIVERHPHTFRVKYAPASRDATIYWGQKDMKFRNNSGGPIYVQTFVRNSRFYSRIYGTRPLSHDVAVESRILSSAKGTRSEAYRVVQNGSQIKREKLSRDYYRPAKS